MSKIVIQSMEKVLRLLDHGTAVMSPARSQLDQIWMRAQAQEAIQQATAEGRREEARHALQAEPKRGREPS